MQASELFKLKERLAEQEVLSRKVAQTRDEEAEKLRAVEKARIAMSKEELDVEKMQKLSLASLISYVKGQYDDQLEKERMEAIEARMAYDRAVSELEAVRDDLKRLEVQQEDVTALKKTYAELLAEKEKELLDSDEQLKGMLDAIGVIQTDLKELDEAIVAGTTLLNRLEDVETSISSARNWGIFDMLGGDFIADVGKHMKINRAQREMAEARVAYGHFSREMEDVTDAKQMDIDISGLMMAADFFFDNIFVDFMVQSRLTASLDNVRGTIRQVKRALEGLEIKKNETLLTLDKMNRSKETFLRGKF